MTATDPQSVAVQLHDWFESILRLTEESLFGIAPEGPHRDAVVLDTSRGMPGSSLTPSLIARGSSMAPYVFFWLRHVGGWEPPWRRGIGERR